MVVAIASSLCELARGSATRDQSLSKLGNCNCHLPLSELGRGLRQGKIEMPVEKQSVPGCDRLHRAQAPKAKRFWPCRLNAIAPMFLAQSQAWIWIRAEKSGTRTGQRRSRRFQPRRFGAQRFPPAPPIATSSSPAVPPRPLAPPIPTPSPATPPRAVSPPPALPVVSSPASGESKGSVTISVSLLASNCRATLVKDIDPKFLAKAKLEIPVEAIEGGIRSGKVDFLWRELCAWMQPAGADELVAAHAETRIGLPLSVVAPLFLQRKPATAAKKAGGFAGDIPRCVSAGGLVAPLATAAEEPPRACSGGCADSSARYESEFEPEPSARIFAAAEPDPGLQVRDLAELFGQPDKRNWTPNEIVQKTSELPGSPAR